MGTGEPTVSWRTFGETQIRRTTSGGMEHTGHYLANVADPKLRSIQNPTNRYHGQATVKLDTAIHQEYPEKELGKRHAKSEIR